MKLKHQLIFGAALSIVLSSATFAKKTEDKGNSYHRRSEAYRENSNRQSDVSSLRGRERAEERHSLKKHKKHKKHKEKYRHDDRYERKHERKEYRRDESSYHNNRERKDGDQYNRYERQRYKERYQNNPVDIVIDQNVSRVKSKIDQVHRKVIGTIDNKARELTGVSTQTEPRTEAKPWWSIFSAE